MAAERLWALRVSVPPWFKSQQALAQPNGAVVAQHPVRQAGRATAPWTPRPSPPSATAYGFPFHHGAGSRLVRKADALELRRLEAVGAVEHGVLAVAVVDAATRAGRVSARAASWRVPPMVRVRGIALAMTAISSALRSGFSYPYMSRSDCSHISRARGSARSAAACSTPGRRARDRSGSRCCGGHGQRVLGQGDHLAVALGDGEAFVLLVVEVVAGDVPGGEQRAEDLDRVEPSFAGVRLRAFGQVRRASTPPARPRRSRALSSRRAWWARRRDR